MKLAVFFGTCDECRKARRVVTLTPSFWLCVDCLRIASEFARTHRADSMGEFVRTA